MRPLIVTETTNLKIEETYHRNGNIKSRQYMSNNQLHRLDGPAVEVFYKNGILKGYEWCQNGLRHRLDAPAYECFRKNGTLIIRSYHQNGQLHRFDGPAYEWFNESGECFSVQYWLNDKRLTKTEHQRQITILKLAAQSANREEVLL